MIRDKSVISIGIVRVFLLLEEEVSERGRQSMDATHCLGDEE